MYKLPIFSAKKMDSDEEVVGVAYEDKKEKCIYISNDAQNLYTSVLQPIYSYSQPVNIRTG